MRAKTALILILTLALVNSPASAPSRAHPASAAAPARKRWCVCTESIARTLCWCP